MLDGLVEQRRYEREERLGTEYLLRYTAAALANVIASFSKGDKAPKEEEIWPIPEIDKIIKKQREKQEREFDKKANEALKRYKRFERKKDDG